MINEELKQKVSDYVKIRKEFVKLSKEIYDYTLENYPDSLEYEEDSEFLDVHISENWLVIDYWDKCYAAPDESQIEIPMDVIINNNWREFIDNESQKRIEDKQKQLRYIGCKTSEKNT